MSNPTQAPSSSGSTSSSSSSVHFGTCGWSDESIKACGRFYPSWVRSSEQRLEFYSRTFACVEVDSSTYAIPRAEHTRKWAASTPAGFKFHFKAFGLFTHRSAAVNTLPWKVRQLLPHDLPPQHSVSLQQLGAEGEQLVWDIFHEALEPVVTAERMGVVLFQFQLSYAVNQQNWEYLEHCRGMLKPSLTMAVEFRNRSWFTDPVSAGRLCAWLSAGGICLVSADELHHETFQKDRQQRGLPPGELRRIMPIALHVTQPAFHYVRVHRRHGTQERIIPKDEIQAWAGRIVSDIAPSLHGPLYFLWGTDWEDAPLLNMQALSDALPPVLRCNWRAHVKALATHARGSIASMLKRPNPASRTEAEAPADLQPAVDGASGECSSALTAHAQAQAGGPEAAVRGASGLKRGQLQQPSLSKPAKKDGGGRPSGQRLVTAFFQCKATQP